MDDDKEQKKLLTRKDLAKRWGVCIGTLKRYEKAGKSPYLRIGRLVRYRIEDIEEIERKWRFGDDATA